MKRLLQVVWLTLVALVLAACQDSTQPEVGVPSVQAATLSPGQSAQFQTSTGAVMTLTVINLTTQNHVGVQIRCSSATPDTEQWDLHARESLNETKVWGGCPMDVINTTDPTVPADLHVSLQVD